jgi:hypothetical protein
VEIKSITAKVLICLPLFMCTNLQAADPILEQLAAMWNKDLPQVTSSGETEIYKVEASNDTLIYYFSLIEKGVTFDTSNKEGIDSLRNLLINKYCAAPYDHYQKKDFKWEHIYVDSEYKFIVSFKASRRDC